MAEPMHDDGMEAKLNEEASITPDGGLKKTILAMGEGSERPEAHDEVTVHYTGTLLDGTKFDSSKDRSEPFTFTLKEGSVIKGWDLGVGTMRKGERAVLRCAPDYAYGARGSPPTIPPNATLCFEVELLHWKSARDILGDGGVMKRVLADGSGWEMPGPRDEAQVRFSASVAGQATPFAASPEGGVSEFVVSEGLQGIAGATQAVLRMKKGEKVQLDIQPAYAYGAQGREGAVPPNAALDVQLELVSWNKVEDVTPDGAVVKKTLESSSDWQTPNEGATVTLRLTGRLEDGTVFDEFPEGQELEYVTDSELQCEGLDAAVGKMRKGERAEVTVRAPYSFAAAHAGNRGAQVPASATVVYDVRLVSFTPAKESYEMSDEEKVASASLHKEMGNKAYKEGKLQRARRLYDKAVGMVNYDKGFSGALLASAREVKRSACLNLAAVALKLKDHKQAIVNCDKVLETDPSSTKAHFRRAQGLIGQADFVEAELAVRAGLMAAPEDPDLAALQKRLRVLQRESAKAEASMYARMLKGGSSFASKGDPPAPTPAAAGSNGTANADAVGKAMAAEAAASEAAGQGDGHFLHISEL